MIRHSSFLAAVLALLLAIAAPRPLGAASTATGSLPVTISISAQAKLWLSASTVSFASANPDTTPLVQATEGAITITAKGKSATGSPMTLTVLASSDLTNGTDSIPVSNVTWTAAGPGFVNGALSATAAQTVASWTSSGSRTGTQTYALLNSWNYPIGTFTTTATYTLTAP